MSSNQYYECRFTFGIFVQMLAKSKYQHVFFDLDHTLWDFDKNSELTLESLYDELKLQGKINSFAEFYGCYVFHNDQLWERFLRGDFKYEEFQLNRVLFALQDCKVNDLEIAHQLIKGFHKMHPRQSLLLPFAKEILDYFKERYILHLLSNGTEEIQSLKMQQSGIYGYFTEIITAEKCSSFKPSRKIFDYALELTGAKVENCIMIGDSMELDIIGAQQAGWDQVYYNPAKKSHGHQPTFEIHSLKELLTFF